MGLLQELFDWGGESKNGVMRDGVKVQPDAGEQSSVDTELPDEDEADDLSDQLTEALANEFVGADSEGDGEPAHFSHDDDELVADRTKDLAQRLLEMESEELGSP